MGKGRDKELIKLRDEALCRRYYYWTEVQRLRFDDALKVLSEREFFISEERIMAIIRRKTREGSDRPIQGSPSDCRPAGTIPHKMTAWPIGIAQRRLRSGLPETSFGKPLTGTPIHRAV